jgi:predicted porin
VMAWDGGDDAAGVQGSDVYVADWVPGGGTFFQLAGNARINPNLTAGFQLTVALETGSRSHQVSQVDDDATASSDILPTVTLANWYLDHKQMGRLTVGRINTATAGLSTIDLGGAGVTANASIGYWNRGFIVVDEDGGASGVNGWSQLLGGNALNGASLSRANAVMYTSPTFGGFSVGASWGEDDLWDVAARYAGEFSGIRLAAGIGYRSNYAGTDEAVADNPGIVGPAGTEEPSQFILSGSIMHVPSGLYLTGSYINQDNDTPGRDDSTLWYVQAGISKNWTGMGNTVFYGEYANVRDGVQNFQNVEAQGIPAVGGSNVDVWGLGVVQHIDAAAMEVFLSYRNFSAEIDDFADINDFNMVVGGARIRF